jgi:peptide/nickel transport system substrate-binding protein
MRRFIFLSFVLVFIIASCAKKEERLPGEVGGSLVIGTTNLPTTISPLSPSIFGSNEILDLLFLHLHRIDLKTGKMKPELASSWEFSEDLSSITYYLRKDVTWWDGSPVTAEDVIYTFEKMKDPATRYPHIASLRFIRDVEVLDPYTIKFTFHKVYADILTDSDIMAVPKHIYEKLGSDFGETPVGNGPYKIKEWIPGSYLVLSFNDAYYRGRPPLDEIVIRQYTNKTAMVQDFSAGNIDIVLTIPPKEAKNLAEKEDISIDSRPGSSYTYLGWNLEHQFLKDLSIRTALSMAINRDTILADIFANMGEVSLGPLPQSSWGCDVTIKPVVYDTAEAKNILAQKGFIDRNRNRIIDKDGTDFTLNIITNIENPERVDMLEYVARDLRKLGIRVNTKTLDAGAFITALRKKEFDGFIMGWTVAEKIDPTLYWHSDSTKGRFNFVSYRNSIVDSLIEQGVAMLNRKEAKKIWDEFQRVVYYDQPYTFLVVPNTISAQNKRVKGAEQGIALANAYTYWIPEAERRITVVAVVDTQVPIQPPEVAERIREERLPAIVEPERILEASAMEDTSTVAVVPGTTAAPPPPKPSVITRAKPVKQVKPQYPESAQSLGATGRVVVRVLVGTDGKVKKATVLSSFGNPACEEVALTAAQQWEFTPATKDGEPFEQNVSIPFDFEP